MKRVVSVGGVRLGEGRIKVQSMTTEKTSGVEKCVAQILRLEEAGCDLVRVAVLDEEDARALSLVKERVHIPVIADIHFSARLAELAVEAGADKLRINPGNLRASDLRRVADCVRRHHIPVRVGANLGSLERGAEARYGRGAEALVASALEEAAALEKLGVEDLVLSVKASSVPVTAEAYALLAEKTEHPLHVGVTEAGGGLMGIVKGSVGIGALLLRGIGDTVRVSLSEDPVLEVTAAHAILRACGLEREFAEVISCPTCGRCEYDCMGLARRVQERVIGVKKPLKIAVMGCVVNGPGEAKDADLGIAGGREFCLIFERGKEPQRVPSEGAEAAFFAWLEEWIG